MNYRTRRILLIVLVSILLLVTILFNLLGDSVRDVLDPSGKNNTLKD